MAEFSVWVPDDEPNIDQLREWLCDFLADSCEFEEFEVRKTRG